MNTGILSIMRTALQDVPRLGDAMDEGVALALTHIWWSWETPVIRKALTAALLDHWLPLAERALKANANAGRHPADFNELTRLRRNPRNVRRVVDGKYASTHGFLLGLAAVLNLEVGSLYPRNVAWVAGTACYLCAGRITEADSCTYAKFCLDIVAADRAHTAEDLERRLSDAPQGTRDAVLRVAKALGPVLNAADRELQKKEASQ